jgi:hypothetical protein
MGVFAPSTAGKCCSASKNQGVSAGCPKIASAASRRERHRMITDSSASVRTGSLSWEEPTTSATSRLGEGHGHPHDHHPEKDTAAAPPTPTQAELEAMLDADEADLAAGRTARRESHERKNATRVVVRTRPLQGGLAALPCPLRPPSSPWLREAHGKPAFLAVRSLSA